MTALCLSVSAFQLTAQFPTSPEKKIHKHKTLNAPSNVTQRNLYTY